MKTIILCGGLGYRLKEETEFKPKPMVRVGGKPILWHIMKIYAHYGFNDFIIALGYKGDMIKEYFINEQQYAHNFTLNTKNGKTKIYKKYKNMDNFKITFIDTGQETLPGERILRLKEYIPKEDQNFMVTYGDGVGNVDLNKLIKFHTKQGTVGTIIGVRPRSKYGLITLDPKNQTIINSFVEKPVLKEWVNGGFMVFKKKFFKYLRPGEMEWDALKRLTLEEQLSLYKHEGFWHSMDTYPDVENLNKLWLDNPEWKVWQD